MMGCPRKGYAIANFLELASANTGLVFLEWDWRLLKGHRIPNCLELPTAEFSAIHAARAFAELFLIPD